MVTIDVVGCYFGIQRNPIQNIFFTVLKLYLKWSARERLKGHILFMIFFIINMPSDWLLYDLDSLTNSIFEVLRRLLSLGVDPIIHLPLKKKSRCRVLNHKFSVVNSANIEKCYLLKISQST